MKKFLAIGLCGVLITATSAFAIDVSVKSGVNATGNYTETGVYYGSNTTDDVYEAITGTLEGLLGSMVPDGLVFPPDVDVASYGLKVTNGSFTNTNALFGVAIGGKMSLEAANPSVGVQITGSNNSYTQNGAGSIGAFIGINNGATGLKAGNVNVANGAFLALGAKIGGEETGDAAIGKGVATGGVGAKINNYTQTGTVNTETIVGLINDEAETDILGLVLSNLGAGLAIGPDSVGIDANNVNLTDVLFIAGAVDGVYLDLILGEEEAEIDLDGPLGAWGANSVAPVGVNAKAYTQNGGLTLALGLNSGSKGLVNTNTTVNKGIFAAIGANAGYDFGPAGVESREIPAGDFTAGLATGNYTQTGNLSAANINGLLIDFIDYSRYESDGRPSEADFESTEAFEAARDAYLDELETMQNALTASAIDMIIGSVGVGLAIGPDAVGINAAGNVSLANTLFIAGAIDGLGRDIGDGEIEHITPLSGAAPVGVNGNAYTQNGGLTLALGLNSGSTGLYNTSTTVNQGIFAAIGANLDANFGSIVVKSNVAEGDFTAGLYTGSYTQTGNFNANNLFNLAAGLVPLLELKEPVYPGSGASAEELDAYDEAEKAYSDAMYDMLMGVIPSGVEMLATSPGVALALGGDAVGIYVENSVNLKDTLFIAGAVDQLAVGSIIWNYNGDDDFYFDYAAQTADGAMAPAGVVTPNFNQTGGLTLALGVNGGAIGIAAQNTQINNGAFVAIGAGMYGELAEGIILGPEDLFRISHAWRYDSVPEIDVMEVLSANNYYGIGLLTDTYTQTGNFGVDSLVNDAVSLVASVVTEDFLNGIMNDDEDFNILEIISINNIVADAKPIVTSLLSSLGAAIGVGPGSVGISAGTTNLTNTAFVALGAMGGISIGGAELGLDDYDLYEYFFNSYYGEAIDINEAWTYADAQLWDVILRSPPAVGLFTGQYNQTGGLTVAIGAEALSTGIVALRGAVVNNGVLAAVGVDSGIGMFTSAYTQNGGLGLALGIDYDGPYDDVKGEYTNKYYSAGISTIEMFNMDDPGAGGDFNLNDGLFLAMGIDADGVRTHNYTQNGGFNVAVGVGDGAGYFLPGDFIYGLEGYEPMASAFTLNNGLNLAIGIEGGAGVWLSGQTLVNGNEYFAMPDYVVNGGYDIAVGIGDDYNYDYDEYIPGAGLRINGGTYNFNNGFGLALGIAGGVGIYYEAALAEERVPFAINGGSFMAAATDFAENVDTYGIWVKGADFTVNNADLWALRTSHRTTSPSIYVETGTDEAGAPGGNIIFGSNAVLRPVLWRLFENDVPGYVYAENEITFASGFQIKPYTIDSLRLTPVDQADWDVADWDHDYWSSPLYPDSPSSSYASFMHAAGGYSEESLDNLFGAGNRQMYVDTATLRYNILQEEGAREDYLAVQVLRKNWGSEVTKDSTRNMLKAIETEGPAGQTMAEVFGEFMIGFVEPLMDALGDPENEGKELEVVLGALGITDPAGMAAQLIQTIDRAKIGSNPEQILPILLGTIRNHEGFEPLNDMIDDYLLMLVYSSFDDCATTKQMDKKGQKYTAWGATRLNQMSISRFDALQTVFNTNLNATSGNYSGGVSGFTTYSGLGGGNWSAWVSPIYSKEYHDAKNAQFSDTDGYFAGVSFGIGKRVDFGSVGIAGHYLSGKESGGGYKVESDTYGIMAGLRTDPLGKAMFNPWMQFNLGYSYTDFDQKRNVTVGSLQGKYKADIDQHAFRVAAAMGQDFWADNLRLTPIVGVDYTYAKQDSYKEKGGTWGMNLFGQKVGSDSMNSLRFKLGGEVAYEAAEKLNVNAHAFYRLEALDTRASLTTSPMFMPELSFKTKGEDYSRSSANLGLGASFAVTEKVNVNGLYDFTFGDKFRGHLFNLSVNVSF